MSKIKSRISSVTRSVEVESDHIDLKSTRHKGLVAYRATLTETVTTVRNKRTFKKEPRVQTFSGVCKKSELDSLLSGKALSAPGHATVSRGIWTSCIIAVRPEYLEVARKVGWRYDSPNPYEGTDVSDPLTAMENGEEVLFIESHGCSHQLFDLDGEPLPVALFFSYIEGGFDESNYDLAKAVQILKARDDVTLVEGGGERSYRYSSKEIPDDDPRKYIGKIPNYNAQRNHTTSIAFAWHPSTEDFRAVWEEVSKKDKDPGSDALRLAVFNTDALGLRKGGAAHFNDYYKNLRDNNPDGSTRRDRYEEDDDDDDDCYC